MARYNRVLYFDRNTDFWTVTHQNEKGKYIIDYEGVDRNDLIEIMKLEGMTSSKDADDFLGERQGNYKTITKKESRAFEDIPDISREQKKVDRALKKWGKLSKPEKFALANTIDDLADGYRQDEYLKKIKRIKKDIPKQHKTEKKRKQTNTIESSHSIVNTTNFKGYNAYLYITPSDFLLVQQLHKLLGGARTEITVRFGGQEFSITSGKKNFKEKHLFQQEIQNKMQQLIDNDDIDEVMFKHFQDGELQIDLKDIL